MTDQGRTQTCQHEEQRFSSTDGESWYCQECGALKTIIEGRSRTHPDLREAFADCRCPACKAQGVGRDQTPKEPKPYLCPCGHPLCAIHGRKP